MIPSDVSLRVVMAINRDVPMLDLMQIDNTLQTEAVIKGMEVEPFSDADEHCIREKGKHVFGYTIDTDRNALPTELITVNARGEIRVNTGLRFTQDLADQLIEHTANEFEGMSEEEQVSYAPTSYTPLIRAERDRGSTGISNPSVGYAVELAESPAESQLYNLVGKSVSVVDANDKPGDLRFIWSVSIPRDRGGPAQSIAIVDMEEDCVDVDELESVLGDIQGRYEVLRTAVVGL